MPTMLIAGASGLIGSATLDLMHERDGWEVVALSRRRPETFSERPYRHLSVDLQDPDATRAAVADLGDVTHVVYAALYEKPGLMSGWTERDQMEVNRAMFCHLMEPLAAAAPLRHVSLMQGTKAYGAHVHPIPTPARERAPRDPHENFYWLQEDRLRELAAEHGFAFTILRPQLVLGGAIGAAMNVVPVIGAYAAIRAERGEPFSYPGGASYVWEAVDARLCAQALAWAAESPAAAGETFNLTNGDVFEWRNLWPAIADALGVEPGPDEPRSLGAWMPEQADAWARIAGRHGLREPRLAALMGESHHYADLCFNHGADAPPDPRFVSTIKIRQAGFGACFDTEDTLRFWIGALQRRRLLPQPAAS